jgi:transposase
MDEDPLRLLLAQGASVEQIGRRFGKAPSTISYWMERFGLQSPNRAKYAAKGGIDRERLEELVTADCSITEIAQAVERSKGTVRHRLRKHGLRTDGNRRARAAAAGRGAGMLTIVRGCTIHGETNFVLEGRGYDRCKRCRQDRVAEHRRGIKQTLVAEAGGCCVACGYDEYLGALQFHHLDPTQKRLTINCSGATLSLATMRAEAAKCVLLCANCHAEIESGVRTLALK